MVLAGCGGSSHSAGTATVTSTVSSATHAATAATGSTAPGKTASANAPASGGSEASAPNAEDGVPYPVHSFSMSPTYPNETTAYYVPTRTHPKVGEVIIFFLPVGGLDGQCASGDDGGQPCLLPVPGLTKRLEMKRVVGLPGDTLLIRDGHVIRNGMPEPEQAMTPCKAHEAGCEFPKPFTVPAGHYYVMADDRQLFEEDSRVWGAIPQSAIVGTVLRP
jgi:signal peptidase I